jgi:hypothetical protein
VTLIGDGSGATAIAAIETGKIQGIVLADPMIMRLTVDGFSLPVSDTRTLAGHTFVYGGRAALAGATATAGRADASRSGPALRQCTRKSCEMGWTPPGASSPDFLPRRINSFRAGAPGAGIFQKKQLLAHYT